MDTKLRRKLVRHQQLHRYFSRRNGAKYKTPPVYRTVVLCCNGSAPHLMLLR